MPSVEQGEHPQMLISIMNVATNPRPSCLLRMDVMTQRTEWIDIGLGQLLASGLGIHVDDEYVYHICIANDAEFSTHLIVLERRTLKVVAAQHLTEVVDGHSVVRHGDELYVASTGTDEILAYRLDGDHATEGRVLWAPTDAHADTHHINSLLVVDGELLCSAFGPRESEGYSWATATNGYIRNVTRATNLVEGLRQPHTATWHDEHLYYCNSPLGTVNDDDGVLAYLYGYSRGLVFAPDGTLYAGTSMGRRPARDPARTDVFDNLHDQGDLHGRCAIVEISPGGLRTEIDLSQRGDEIYDLRLMG